MAKTETVVERLREIFQRRRYGAGDDYDPDFDILEPAADLISALQMRVGELETRTARTIAAWDALPSGNYDPKVVESWLSVIMAPAFKKARTLLGDTKS